MSSGETMLPRHFSEDRVGRITCKKAQAARDCGSFTAFRAAFPPDGVAPLKEMAHMA